MDIEVNIGRIGRGHGLSGEVTVHVISSEPDQRFARGARVVTEAGDALTVERVRRQGTGLVVKFAELSDRAAADALRGVRLLARVAEDSSPADPEEFYDRQLIGLRVETPNGDVVGTIESVEHPPAQDLLVLRVGDRLRYVPFVSELVPSVDLKQGVCIVAEIPGLLDDEATEAR